MLCLLGLRRLSCHFGEHQVARAIGPVAKPKVIVRVPELPKTRSGKILRATMVKIADGQEFKVPATIDDPAILDEITIALKSIGYPAA